MLFMNHKRENQICGIQFIEQRMQRLLIFISLVGFCLCSYSQVHLEREWFGWKKLHSKVYSQEEENARWKVWRQNYHKIQQHNKANHSFTLGLNQFADMTQEEFAQYYLSTPRDASEFPHSGIIHQPTEDRDDGDRDKDDDDDDSGRIGSGGVDWRKKGYVTSVKNQGQCGSCWAFSATGALEGQMYRKTGSLISLSEQQLIDCSWSYGNAGCNGGLMDYAFKYVKSNGGLCSANAYPYKGYMWTCKSNSCNSVAYCTGYTDIKSGSEDNLLSAVSNYGPVSVAIDASSYQFQFYSSGVYYDSSCSSSKLNHGVLVVGYGTYNDKNYWIVKNSWGTSWGQSGYVSMSRGQNNMCGIASAASFPSVG